MISRMSAALTAIVITLGLLLSGCQDGRTVSAEEPKGKPTAPAREVRVTPAAERTVARTVSATGTLAADEQVVLGTKVAGRLAEIAVDLGTRVRRGQEVRNRQAVIAQRRSELDLARQQLADTVILSPLDGAVSLKQASVGEYLTAGTPIATLVRVHPLRLRVLVPEREGAGVRAGHAVTLTVEGDPTVYRGRVVRLSPVVQEQNRTLLVEAEVPNDRGFLRPGSFARVEIMTEVSQPVVTVPASAIIVFAGVEKVLVVRQGRTAEVRVTSGRRFGEDVEIIDGLKRGEAVVGRPGNLVGGQPVTVTP